jgi:hypothetical protein
LTVLRFSNKLAEQKWIFIEEWVEVLPQPNFLLLMCKSDTLYEILNPYDNKKVVFSADNYEDAYYWLREDEYNKIGRFLYEDA